MAKFSVPATPRRAAWLTIPACCIALSALPGVAQAQLGDLMKSAPTGGSAASAGCRCRRSVPAAPAMPPG